LRFWQFICAAFTKKLSFVTSDSWKSYLARARCFGIGYLGMAFAFGDALATAFRQIRSASPHGTPLRHALAAASTAMRLRADAT